MIQFAESFVTAMNVLEEVFADERSDELNATIEAYQNGREQGYSILKSTAKGLVQISIAQDRTSDNIVVYVGTYSSQALSHDAYKSAKYFNSKEYKKAAEYVVQKLID